MLPQGQSIVHLSSDRRDSSSVWLQWYSLNDTASSTEQADWM